MRVWSKTCFMTCVLSLPMLPAQFTWTAGIMARMEMIGYLGELRPTYWDYMLRRSEQRLSEQSFQRTLRAHDQEQPPAPRHPPPPAQPVLLLRNNRLLLLATDVASRTTGATTIHVVALPNRPSRRSLRLQGNDFFVAEDEMSTNRLSGRSRRDDLDGFRTAPRSL